MISQLNDLTEKKYIKKKVNLINVGVGGQGVIRVTKILAWAALLDEYQVRTAETHGMAQRGGTVISYLRFGTEITGPLIARGNADIILAFEMSEALRVLNFAGPNTYLFVNDKIQIPPIVYQTGFKYPSNEEMQQQIKNSFDNAYFFNAHELALKVGNNRVSNVVMLGVLSGSEKLPIKKESLESSISRFVPIKAQEVNLNAFQLGIEKGKSIRRQFL